MLTPVPRAGPLSLPAPHQNPRLRAKVTREECPSTNLREGHRALAYSRGLPPSGCAYSRRPPGGTVRVSSPSLLCTRPPAALSTLLGMSVPVVFLLSVDSPRR